MLKEKISEGIGVKYIYIPEKKCFLCENGVMFTLEEYKKGLNIPVEYERREKEDKLYDYAYAKSTGILRKKREATKEAEREQEDRGNVQEHTDTNNRFTDSRTRVELSRELDKAKGLGRDTSIRWNTNSSKSVLAICALLAFTSVISMYVSTLHTATYLMDYADVFSAWLMSASVTAYNATAFEVSVMFHVNKRNFMAVIFMLLWIFVTVFSMATTVSVFYDKFNFQESQIAEENKQSDSNKLALELLQKKEKDLREAIEFKKRDIEYRQEHDYATTAVRNELNKLQEELQSNLSSQQNVVEATPEVTQKVIKRKESLFSFLGRLMHLEGGILEFIMSTLSAIFVNLISPLSATAVIELLKKDSIKVD